MDSSPPNSTAQLNTSLLTRSSSVSAGLHPGALAPPASSPAQPAAPERTKLSSTSPLSGGVASITRIQSTAVSKVVTISLRP
jgi:hypothetical protein